MDKIFKYFNGNENTLDSLKNNYLWFSKPQYFNDPFDCNMKIIKYYNDFINTIESRFSDRNIKDMIINNTKDFGICCFSETNENQHMWAHYANSHKGICVEYRYNETDFDDYFSLEVLKCKCVLQKVDYRNKLINLDGKIQWDKKCFCAKYETINSILSLPLDLKKTDKLFEKLLLQKNKQIWSNENERRLILSGRAIKHIQEGIAKECIIKDVGYMIPIKRKLITSIIFGVSTTDDLKEKIRNIFGDSISYKQAELDFANWKLKIVTQ